MFMYNHFLNMKNNFDENILELTNRREKVKRKVTKHDMKIAKEIKILDKKPYKLDMPSQSLVTANT